MVAVQLSDLRILSYYQILQSVIEWDIREKFIQYIHNLLKLKHFANWIFKRQNDRDAVFVPHHYVGHIKIIWLLFHWILLNVIIFTWQKHCLLESINRNKKYVFQFNLHWKNYLPFGCVKRAFVQIQNLSCPSFQRCLLRDRKQMEFLENWWWLQGSLNWIL